MVCSVFCISIQNGSCSLVSSTCISYSESSCTCADDELESLSSESSGRSIPSPAKPAPALNLERVRVSV